MQNILHPMTILKMFTLIIPKSTKFACFIRILFQKPKLYKRICETYDAYLQEIKFSKCRRVYPNFRIIIIKILTYWPYFFIHLPIKLEIKLVWPNTLSHGLFSLSYVISIKTECVFIDVKICRRNDYIRPLWRPMHVYLTLR